MATPSEWEKHLDDETQTPYYYNTRTGESSWEEPEGFVETSADGTTSNTTSAKAAPAHPPRWRRYIDDSNGKPYYYDEANDITQWEEPEGKIRDASEDEEEDEDETETNKHEGEAKKRDDKEPASKNHEECTNGEGKEVESQVPPTDDQVSKDKEGQTTTCNWVKHMDKATGKPYYHDTISNKTQWETPEHFTDASQSTVISAEYLEYLHRSRAEKLTHATQRALDPEGNLSRLNALLSKIGDSGASAGSTEGAEAVDAPEDIEQSLKDRARAEWQQHVDPQSQRYYYHNIVTGETQWDKPDAPIVSALADWIPPEMTEPEKTNVPARTVSGHHYAATAKFNRLTGRFEKLGGEEYFESRGVATDREGRQMSHFFDIQQLEKNREDAKRIKEELKRKNIDWKKVQAEKKARKQKRQNEWIYQD